MGFFKDKSILNFITAQEEKILFSNIYEKLKSSYEKGKPCFSDFLDARQISLAERIFSFLGENLIFDGKIDNSERKILYLAPKSNNLPIKIIKIPSVNKDMVSHRDVLGSLMGLGIKREKIGDIIINEHIYFAVKDEILKYVFENLTKVKNYNVDVFLCEDEEVKRQDEFIDLNLTVASLRIDCIVGAALNLSRERAKELILSGAVSVNHFEVSDISKTIKENDIISIKRFGRFKLAEISGMTKKDRYKAVIKKWC